MAENSGIGRWSQSENYLYYIFLKLKEQQFQSYAQRKSAKVFDYFAHLIGTRSRHQVKGYHHKLMKKHQTVSAYIIYYEEENFKKLAEYAALYITPKLYTIIDLQKRKGSLPTIPFLLPEPTSSQRSFQMEQLNHESSMSSKGIQTQENIEPSAEENIVRQEDQELSLQSFPIYL